MLRSKDVCFHFVVLWSYLKVKIRGSLKICGIARAQHLCDTIFSNGYIYFFAAHLLLETRSGAKVNQKLCESYSVKTFSILSQMRRQNYNE